jgi:hypothetical protein
MISLPRSFFPAAAVLVALMPNAGAAQQPMTMTETKSAAPYHPGLGELMTAFVQPRHTKLGLAGNARNWPLAAYELHELTETFDEVGRLVPTHDNMPIPAMIASTVKPTLATLDAAIKATDVAAFTKAYADLTTACNTCHQSANHPLIVIQVPITSPFPNQDFRPPQK